MDNKANITLIKDSLCSIVKQLAVAPKARPSNEIKSSASKIYQLLSQENAIVERFYFIYLTCQLCGNDRPNRVDKLMKVILPSPPTAHSMALISDLISFALCHSSIYTTILDNMSSYLNASDLVTVDVESWQQAESLSIDSPSFCSALISRSDLCRLGIEKKLLAKWLQDLSKIEQEFPVPSLNHMIRYSLFHQHPTKDMCDEEKHYLELAASDLHFGLLTLIQSRRCQTLTNQFLIDVVSTLAQQSQTDEDERKEARAAQMTMLIDRFAQILSVAAASKVTTITNALRNSLAKLDSNQLIASVISWQNK